MNVNNGIVAEKSMIITLTYYAGVGLVTGGQLYVSNMTPIKNRPLWLVYGISNFFRILKQTHSWVSDIYRMSNEPLYSVSFE